MKTQSVVRNTCHSFTMACAVAVLHFGLLAGSAQTGEYLFTGNENTGSTTNITLNPGLYVITAYGARGGSLYSINNYGAEMEAEFNFTTTTTLTLLVGGAGDTSGDSGGGGGGGGSFVVNGSAPLVVAGGGGGDSWTEEATPGRSTWIVGDTSGGSGGGGAGWFPGCGGGGFSGNGGAGVGGNGFGGATFNDYPGISYLNGGFGGFGLVGNYGGYGGGGGGGYESGSGGGGYNGGSGGNSAAIGGIGGYVNSGNGGGSYIDSSAIQTIAAVSGVASPDDSQGNGEIIITPAPMLCISQSGNTVCVYWPAVSGFSLLQDTNFMVPSGWTPTPSDSVTTLNGTNYLNITPPAGSMYFRLVP